MSSCLEIGYFYQVLVLRIIPVLLLCLRFRYFLDKRLRNILKLGDNEKRRLYLKTHCYLADADIQLLLLTDLGDLARSLCALHCFLKSAVTHLRVCVRQKLSFASRVHWVQCRACHMQFLRNVLFNLKVNRCIWQGSVWRDGSWVLQMAIKLTVYVCGGSVARFRPVSDKLVFSRMHDGTWYWW